MLVKTVFLLKPLEARNAADGTNRQTDRQNHGHRNLYTVKLYKFRTNENGHIFKNSVRS